MPANAGIHISFSYNMHTGQNTITIGTSIITSFISNFYLTNRYLMTGHNPKIIPDIPC